MAFERRANSITPRYSLYPYQRQVLDDIVSALHSPECRVIAHLPTGAGKTRVASHAACRLLNARDTEDALVFWLASSEELCEQAAEELAHAWTFLGLREARIHRHWGNSSLDLRRLESGFLVTGLAKLRSAALKDNTLLAHLAHRAAAVIFDEAHQAVAQTFSFMTEQLCSARQPLLGLTATPGRTSDLTDADFRLAKMFKYSKVTIDPKGHDNPVTYLIQHRYLADPRFVPISFSSDSIVSEPLPDTDYSSHDLKDLGLNEARTHKIVEVAERASSRHVRTIVFCPSVESALNCSTRLRQRGIATFAITANTPGEVRQDMISSFKGESTERMVMFNYGVLTAGFDAPRTSCVIIARPTKSLVLYSQMAGRAMRGPKAGGNLKAVIYTVADTGVPGFGSVVDAFTNWEELWTLNSTNSQT